MTSALSKFRLFLPAATFAMAAEFLMGLSDSASVEAHIAAHGIKGRRASSFRGYLVSNLMTAIPVRRNLTTTGFNRNVFNL